MKTNITKSYKFFVAVIALVLICTVAFGASKAFAEPPLKDRVEILGTGSFKPSELYNDGLIDRNDSEITVVSWLPTTELMFSEMLWKDTDDNGVIELTQDVYSHESFYTETLSRETGYPICDIGKGDYYIIPLSHYLDFEDSVIVQCQISKDNDEASLANTNKYWLDADNAILYLQKEWVDSSLDGKDLDLRAEVIRVAEDINTVTKKLGIFTVFDEDIDNTYGLYNSTPNEIYHQPFKDWAFYGLEYTLVQPDKLAYVTADNLDVFVNGLLLEKDQWYYDATNGRIAVNCDAYTTRDIIVKFNKIENPDSSQIALQTLQAGNMGQAGENDMATLKSVMGTMKSQFLTNITFTEMPQVGNYDVLNSTGTLRYDANGKCTTSIMDAAPGYACDTTTINTEAQKVVDRLGLVDGYVQGNGTIAMSLGAVSTAAKQYAIGRISYNLALAEYHRGDAQHSVYLSNAVTAIENYFSGEGPDISEKGAWTTKWNVPGCGRSVYIAARTGTLSTTFVGGTIDNTTEGYAMFDMICCEMAKPWDLPYEVDGGDFPGTQWVAQATIVDVDTKSKDLIICAWSASWHDVSVPHINKQKIMGFTRVPYTYDSDGYIQFSKKNEKGENLAGAIYHITGITDPTYFKAVTTTDAQIIIQLPIGEYMLTEYQPPYGYAKTNTSQKFVVTADHAEESTALQLTVEDTPQKVNGTLTVYDKPAYYNGSKFIPVEGVQFDLYDENGNKVQSNLKTDKDGKITFEFNAIDGNHYLLQSHTVTNYAMDADCEKKIMVQPSSGTWADTTGEHKTWESYHLEPRQIAQIVSQVLDLDLTENGRPTPAVLSEQSADQLSVMLGELDIGYVSTIGAVYNLYTTEDIFLGYDPSNKAIVVDEGTRLKVCWSSSSVPNALGQPDQFKYKKANNKLRAEFNVPSVLKDGHSYVSAYTVRNPFDENDTNLYPLPNGSYEWRLVTPSKGYALDADNPNSVSAKNSTTSISLPWEGPTTKTRIITADDPVIEVRQRAVLNLYVKSYTVSGRNSQKGYELSQYSQPQTVVKDKGLAVLDSTKLNKKNVKNYKDFFLPHILKTVETNAQQIGSTSADTIQVYDKNDIVLEVEAVDKVNNAVYELINLWPIVDIETGQTIDAMTVLGTYQVQNGHLQVTKLGSNSFVSTSANKTYGAVEVKTVDKKHIVTSDLPNGVYMFRVLHLPSEYISEMAAADDVVDEPTAWTKNNFNDELLEAHLGTYLWKRDPDTDPQPKVAPDPTPGDPDDPTPDTPPDGIPPQIDLPEDPTEIPTVEIDWVDKNFRNIAYRITDTVNITVVDGVTTYDVQDKLPTTFAFYLDNNLIRDTQEAPLGKYTYEMSFYYEIPADEYNKAPAADKSSGVDITKTYIQTGVNSYAKKFEMNDGAANDYIGKHILLNPDSAGYNGNMTTIKTHNATISGALYNTKWLNDKLTENTDHEFDVYVVTRATYEVKSINGKIHETVYESHAGVLRIKVRELINLD